MAIHPNNTFAKNLIDQANKIPELKDGFRDLSIIHDNKAFIDDLLSCIFPKLLTDTNISAATFPWSNQYFNPTEKFKSLIEESGTNFCINDDKFDPDSIYRSEERRVGKVLR